MKSIEPQELKALIERIITSGELGRSKTYAAILSYLYECSIKNESPKEIAIALDVLGRGIDFDVAKDSIVRVHIYHLRNKLQAYFTKFGKNEKYRIDIPKGQYIITTRLNESEQKIFGSSLSGRQLSRRPITAWLMALMVILLGANFLVEFQPVEITEKIEVVMLENPAIWQAILDDEEPILLVIGDYYIFGELDEFGNVSRMVRAFSINSEEDLAFEKSLGLEKTQRYFNLDLSYIPTSVAFALTELMPVLANDSSRVSIKMISELNTADLASNHIIYLGYLSGLESLNGLMFASSGLSIGSTYDELVKLSSGEHFLSSSGLSIGENSFQDYGMISTFPSPNGHQFVFIAGMRDEGLRNVAKEAKDFNGLISLEKSLANSGELLEQISAYEALYEVFGFDGTNFDANLVYSNTLDTEVIWEARLIGNQGR